MPKKTQKIQDNELQNNKLAKNDKEPLDRDKDSSEISEIDENESLSDCFNYDIKKEGNVNDEIDEEAQTEYVRTVVFDYVIKYIKLDDVIKKKQNEHKKEMKAIKDTKEQLEQFLLNYLEKVNQEYVELANMSKLTKTETTTKSPPKLEDITLCLMDGFKEYEIYENEEEIKRVVSELVKKIDDKRETKTRKFLRRENINEKQKKNAKAKAKDQKESSHGKKVKQIIQDQEPLIQKQEQDQEQEQEQVQDQEQMEVQEQGQVQEQGHGGQEPLGSQEKGQKQDQEQKQEPFAPLAPLALATLSQQIPQLKKVSKHSKKTKKNN